MQTKRSLFSFLILFCIAWYGWAQTNEQTIFLDDVRTVIDEVQSSDQVYYSKEPIEFDIQSSLADLQKLDVWIEEIANKIRELDTEYGENDVRYTQTRDEVMSIIREIRNTKEWIKLWIDRIRMYQRVVLQWWYQIEQIRSEIMNMKKYIVDFTNYLYALHNNIYADTWNIDLIKLFFKSDGAITDSLTNWHMIETIVTKIDALVSKLQNHEKQQIQRIRVSNKNKIDVRSEIMTFSQKMDNLEQKRKYLIDYLDLYKNNKDKIEWTVASLFDTRKDTHAAIVEEIQQIKQGKYVAWYSVDEKLEELKTLEPYAYYERAWDLTWPILPVSAIWTYFKDPWYKDQYGVEHYGIEIPAQQLSPLYATHNALVYSIKNDQSLWVNWMILIHDDGMISVYQFVNNFFVSPWDLVRRGQLIWYSWWEPWTMWAWFISKRPNLTYMVFKDGEFIDPLVVLDLSVFPNQANLDKKYHIKYLKDLYRRPRDIYKVNFMAWDSHNERRVKFLQTYWVGIYRELAFWLDAAEWSNIDPDMWICIWFAESTMGKYLTTSNNIGNVWNNDRWDRISFWSALEWARLIFQTLNNQYLWHYNTIIELSWYWNKDWKIYASSPYNRQNNVIKCLSMIKWRYVPDDYPYRISLWE